MSTRGKKLRSKIQGAVIKTAYLPDGFTVVAGMIESRWKAKVAGLTCRGDFVETNGEASGMLEAIRDACSKWHKKAGTKLRELVEAQFIEQENEAAAMKKHLPSNKRKKHGPPLAGFFKGKR